MPQTDGADYQTCPKCKQRIPLASLVANQMVCPRARCTSRHHFMISARTRIELLADRSTFIEWDSDLVEKDPLEFPGYAVKMEQSKAKSQMSSGALTGKMRIDERWVAVAATSYGFMAGAMGSLVGERFALCIERATKEKLPLLLISASGAGAMMQEGVISLMQMPIISGALRLHKKAGLLSIGILTQSTNGGVSASWASLPQIILAEPGAEIGFVGKKVASIGALIKAPVFFRTAEYQYRFGKLDGVVSRLDMRDTLIRILHASPSHNRREWKGSDEIVRQLRAQLLRHDSPFQHNQTGELDEHKPPTGAESLMRAREFDRPSGLFYVRSMFDSFFELKGDHRRGVNLAILGGIATLEGLPMVVICQQKDKEHRYACGDPVDYHFALRLMELAQERGIPLVTIVDTPGASSSVESENDGISVVLAKCQEYMMGMTVPVISAVVGEGGSGGAIAIAVANHVLIQENAVYSVIDPQGAAAILWNNDKRAPEAADLLKIAALDTLRLDVTDQIVSEPERGAHTNPSLAADLLKVEIVTALAKLYGKRKLDDQRYRRFRAINDFLKGGK